MEFTNVDFRPLELSFDALSMQSVSIPSSETLYRYLESYIPNNVTENASNMSVKLLPSKKAAAKKDGVVELDERISVGLGIGQFTFKTFEGETVYALHHYMGQPVGGGCGVEVMKRLVLFISSGEVNVLTNFLNQLANKMETSEEGKFICFSWNIRYNRWTQESKVTKRSIDSVVLPVAVKNSMIQDLAKFLSTTTHDFYLRHGIPYRRSYLFYGIPGTGKTSMVQALAAHFNRNVCFLLPTHPEMTDDSLRQAVNSIPVNSIVVFEDIDALFAKNRTSQMKSNALTFSGLLNALDGISASTGQVFILTTNLRENLDNALIRNGRVDLHFEFTFAVAEQMQQMWSNFYPQAAALKVDFSNAVDKSLNEQGLQVTTAGLQHFFVSQMDSTAEEALKNVPSIVEAILQNSSRDMLTEAKAAEPTIAVVAATEKSFFSSMSEGSLLTAVSAAALVIGGVTTALVMRMARK